MSAKTKPISSERFIFIAVMALCECKPLDSDIYLLNVAKPFMGQVAWM
jgi:hypothetical protein